MPILTATRKLILNCNKKTLNVRFFLDSFVQGCICGNFNCDIMSTQTCRVPVEPWDYSLRGIERSGRDDDNDKCICQKKKLRTFWRRNFKNHQKFQSWQKLYVHLMDFQLASVCALLWSRICQEFQSGQKLYVCLMDSQLASVPALLWPRICQEFQSRQKLYVYLMDSQLASVSKMCMFHLNSTLHHANL